MPAEIVRLICLSVKSESVPQENC
jgi:hypothetical protein